MPYSIVGGDGNQYGPVEPHVLTEWARDGRIVPTTGIIDHVSGRQFLAKDLPELSAVFAPPPLMTPPTPTVIAPHAVLYPPGAKFGPDGRPLKSKLTAGLLGLFFGGLGVHRFYLGYSGIGALQLLLTLVLWLPTCGVSWIVVGIWALIDSIMCFTGSMRDAEGRPLAD